MLPLALSLFFKSAPFPDATLWCLLLAVYMQILKGLPDVFRQ